MLQQVSCGDAPSLYDAVYRQHQRQVEYRCPARVVAMPPEVKSRVDQVLAGLKLSK